MEGRLTLFEGNTPQPSYGGPGIVDFPTPFQVINGEDRIDNSNYPVEIGRGPGLAYCDMTGYA